MDRFLGLLRRNKGGASLVVATLLGIFCLGTVLYGQSSSVDPPGIASGARKSDLLAITSGLPTDFRADIQIRWFESQGLIERSRNRQLIVSLYDNLDYVHDELPFDYVVPVQSDTLERELVTAAMVTKLDALSLRLRIIRAMFPVDPRWATRSLKNLPLEIPRIGCETTLVPDVSAYYKALGDLLFGADVHHSAADIPWLEERIARIGSPIELQPTAELLAKLKLPEADRHRVLLQFAVTLETLSAQDRELDRTASSHSLAAALRVLLAAVSNDTSYVARLLVSYRKFVQASFRQPACSDVSTKWEQVVRDFNQLVVDFHQSEYIQPIGAPTRSFDGGKAAYHSLPDSSAADELLAKMYNLRTRRHSGFELFDNSDSLWQSYSSDLLTLVNQIDPMESKCSECAYFFRTKILLAGFDLLPDGALKERLLRALVDSLASSGLQNSNPELWAFQAQLLINMSRKPTADQERKLRELQSSQLYVPLGPSSMSDDIKDYLQSANGILRAYVMSDELFRSKFTAPYLAQ